MEAWLPSHMAATWAPKNCSGACVRAYVCALLSLSQFLRGLNDPRLGSTRTTLQHAPYIFRVRTASLGRPTIRSVPGRLARIGEWFVWTVSVHTYNVQWRREWVGLRVN